MAKSVDSSNSGGGRRGVPRPAITEKRLCVSVTEVAEMLGLSRNNAYDLVKTKQLPSIRFGKRILIPRAALEKRLEKEE
ncbi:helix-turn-helix domain-containing protein [Chloroflexota bacterium]